jgi:hypothetical protein
MRVNRAGRFDVTRVGVRSGADVLAWLSTRAFCSTLAALVRVTTGAMNEYPRPGTFVM